METVAQRWTNTSSDYNKDFKPDLVTRNDYGQIDLNEFFESKFLTSIMGHLGILNFFEHPRNLWQIFSNTRTNFENSKSRVHAFRNLQTDTLGLWENMRMFLQVYAFFYPLTPLYWQAFSDLMCLKFYDSFEGVAEPFYVYEFAFDGERNVFKLMYLQNIQPIKGTFTPF